MPFAECACAQVHLSIAICMFLKTDFVTVRFTYVFTLAFTWIFAQRAECDGRLTTATFSHIF